MVMKETVKKLIVNFLSLVLFLFTTTTVININLVSALENNSSPLTKKISKDYTKKFCNAVAFGLSKESAMNFSFEENKKVFQKRKGIKDINEKNLAKEISISVIENCGYPINLIGDKGIEEFKEYYLQKYREHSNKYS